jgi:hypothetical protein
MKLREFTDEDILEYALTHGGRNIINVFKEIEAEYNQIRADITVLIRHRTMINDLKNKISILIDKIIDLHNHCLKSEDDNETRTVASSLKSMSEELNKIFDNI